MTDHKLLVDTDVLIDFLRKKTRAKNILQEASQGYDLFTSVITLAEIMAGMRPSEKADTEALIAGLTPLPVTEQIARRSGELHQKKDKKKFLLADCLIAATALVEGCLLLTFNKKDFQVDGLQFYDGPYFPHPNN
jgi:hypothetical protein